MPKDIDIENEIRNGLIGAITLDTSIFGKPEDTSLETPLLRRVEQFKGTDVKFVLPDVVVLEVKAHLEALAADAQTKLHRAMRLLERSWSTSKTSVSEAAETLLGGETPATVTEKRLEAFIKRTGCMQLQATGRADVGELIQRYFSHAAPFSEKEEKKYEFPDAIALLTLESWAASAGTKVLVVSKDGDWKRFCDDSKNLIFVDKLGPALGYFHKDKGVACKLLFERLIVGDEHEVEKNNLRNAIEVAIQRHVDLMTFVPEASAAYFFEDEVVEVAVGDYAVDQGDRFIPIDMGDDYLVAELLVRVEVDITADFTFLLKDWIDKDYIRFGSASVTKTESLELTVVVTFTGEIPGAPEIGDIEVDGDTYQHVDFGSIEPDMHDSTDEEFV